MKQCATFLLLSFIFASNLVQANDKVELELMLNDFLAGTEQISVHDNFWAEDLIYTSSTGQRINKKTILNALTQADSNSNEQNNAKYSAENVDIRLFGDTAIVAFTLVSETKAEKDVERQSYLNTGTFLKRNHKWQAVAWQATKIPQKT